MAKQQAHAGSHRCEPADRKFRAYGFYVFDWTEAAVEFCNTLYDRTVQFGNTEKLRDTVTSVLDTTPTSLWHLITMRLSLTGKRCAMAISAYAPAINISMQ